MEKVVVSLGGSILVPGKDDAQQIRRLADLFRDLSSRVKLFLVTGGGRIARYYIETGRSLGMRERSLDELGIGITRLNARLLGAALRGRANPRPATTYAEASRLSRRFPIVIMAGTRPGHTTDRVTVSLARFIRADRIVNATGVKGVYTEDPLAQPRAKMLDRITFEDLVALAGRRTPWTAGPSIVFDPVAAAILLRDRRPLRVVNGRDMQALRSAILGEPFTGTLVADA